MTLLAIDFLGNIILMKNILSKLCPNCKKMFTNEHLNTHHFHRNVCCSHRCASEYKKTCSLSKPCEWKGCTNLVTNNHVISSPSRFRQTRFCSKSCSVKWQMTQPGRIESMRLTSKSPERNKKLSESIKNLYIREPWRREFSSKIHKGKFWTKESRLKMSESTKKRFRRDGFPKYLSAQAKREKTLIDKIRNLVDYKVWWSLVRIRDKFSCVFCNSKERIEVDHINPVCLIVRKHKIKTLEDAQKCGELFDITNGRVLCRKCHYATPTHTRNWKKYYRTFVPEYMNK